MPKDSTVFILGIATALIGAIICIHHLGMAATAGIVIINTGLSISSIPSDRHNKS